MRIIVFGLGEIGGALAEQLSDEGHSVTGIDIDANLVEDLSYRFDFMGVVGNEMGYTTLKQAGIESADVVIAVTGNDEMNLLCCLIARRLGNCSTVARIQNPAYNNEWEFLKNELGISLIINPEYAVSADIIRHIKVPTAIDVDVFARGHIELLSFKILPGSRLKNTLVKNLKNDIGVDVLVCAVVRDTEVFIPSGDFTLYDGDEVFITATPKAALDFFDKIEIGSGRVRDVVIAGGGVTSYYLANQLLKSGISVKIIEKDFERCEKLSSLLPKAMVINGESNNKELLLEEGVPSAGSFVTLTNVDEENIMLSLFVKNISSNKVKTITKINRNIYDEVIESLELGSVVIPKVIITDTILQYVRALQNSTGSNVKTLYKLVEGRVEALEFDIKADCGLINISFADMKIKNNVLIGCIYRAGETIIPRGNDSFKSGDTVVVVTSVKGLIEIEGIIEKN